MRERYYDLQVTPPMVNLIDYAIRTMRDNVRFVQRLSKSRTVWDVRYKNIWYRVVYKKPTGIISFATPESIREAN
jgi:hypothetical protein